MLREALFVCLKFLQRDGVWTLQENRKVGQISAPRRFPGRDCLFARRMQRRTAI